MQWSPKTWHGVVKRYVTTLRIQKCLFLQVSVLNISFQAALVHTAETTRIKFFLDLLLDCKKPVMLVGNAGTGKTVLMQDKLNSLSDDWLVANVPFNFYTTSEMLQVTQGYIKT